MFPVAIPCVSAYYLTSMKDQIAQRVIGVIASYAELETGQVSLNTSFEDLGLDSLDALSLITELEDEFDISISYDEVFSISTVLYAVEVVQRSVLENDEE